MQITKKKNRSFAIELSHKTINTPFFFPAISTIKTNFTVSEYLDLVLRVGYPGFLISSYDIYREKEQQKLIEKINQATKGNVITLMDSGNYEAYWNDDADWDLKKFESVLKKINTDLCFSFDVAWKKDKNPSDHVKEIISSTARTVGLQASGDTIPIIHSTPENFPKTVKGVVSGIYPQVIGVPERELGASLFERATTLKRIRDELNGLNQDIPIHILGTGNPTSILVYSLCGADLYDGLEWCNTVANPENGHLHHFVQKDLFKCDCNACKADMPYHLQTMAHNLLFYENFLKEIRESLLSADISRLLDRYLPKHVHKRLKEISGLK